MLTWADLVMIGADHVPPHTIPARSFHHGPAGHGCTGNLSAWARGCRHGSRVAGQGGDLPVVLSARRASAAGGGAAGAGTLAPASDGVLPELHSVPGAGRGVAGGLAAGAGSRAGTGHAVSVHPAVDGPGLDRIYRTGPRQCR